MTEKTEDEQKEIPMLEVSPEELSTNFRWVFGKSEQFDIQTTVRGNPTKEEINEHIASAIDAMTIVVQTGGHASKVYQSPKLKSEVDSDTAAALDSGKAVTVPVTQTAIMQQSTTPNVIWAEQLVGSVNEGKSYWKIKGGQFKKFGISIYPEVLVSAGFTSLKEGSIYDLTKGGDGSTVHYNAYFSTKTDGKPEKITKLERV
jgi:hypothetical protein